MPKIVTKTLGIYDILQAIDPEIVKLREDIEQFKKEFYVKLTTNFIDRWEADFSLPYDSLLTLAERRQRVLNKLARKKTLNWENLKLLIKSNLPPNTQFYISNHAARFSFSIYVNSDNLAQIEQMKNAVRQAKPAYLIFEVLQTDYARRCGTFNCGTEPL